MKIYLENTSYKVRDGTCDTIDFADLLGISEELLRRELPQSGIPYIMSENGEVRIPCDCVERILFREDEGGCSCEKGFGLSEGVVPQAS